MNTVFTLMRKIDEAFGTMERDVQKARTAHPFTRIERDQEVQRRATEPAQPSVVQRRQLTDEQLMCRAFWQAFIEKTTLTSVKA